LTCQPEGPCFALPVKARRAKARERLPSYREPASVNPQPTYTETCRNPCTRAPFRLLSIRAPRQAVLRTSSRLAPSRFTNRPCDLPVEKTRDASNRCLPPNRTACTRTSRVPGSLSQLSLRGRPVESWAPRGTTGGPDVSRRPKTASADRHRALLSVSTASRPGEPNVGVVFPRRRCDRASDTPVATLSSPSRLRRLRDGCHLAARPPFERFRAGRRCVSFAKTTLNAVS
jgi:hypothetical protein